MSDISQANHGLLLFLLYVMNSIVNQRAIDSPFLYVQLQKNDIPQIVMVSFEGTITKTNVEFYKAILQETNPNNCAARGTFFITDEGSDYSVIKALYNDGHEVGISSIRGTAPSSFTDWINEFNSKDTKNVVTFAKMPIKDGVVFYSSNKKYL
ncbi:hypothetical protein DPMN_075520 [Dreissena polymorpha]|uniref:Uncharacterized protein n=1 Tax=Dreissena polymorpha TaxID=45954 RepID=A0A9D3YL79_DREPO|nr:hypothetical protein DPMN_075520 [Dreissena polymorpha]